MVLIIQRQIQTYLGSAGGLARTALDCSNIGNMDSFIFCDITPCSPLKANRRFGKKQPPSSGSKNKPSMHALLADYLMLVSFGLFFEPESAGERFFRNVSLFSI
jgi:hypothetical protein